MNSITTDINYKRPAISVNAVTGKVTVNPNKLNAVSKPKPQTVKTDAKTESAKQATKTAEAFKETYIEGALEILATPDLTKGTALMLVGLGKMFSGKYYVRRAIHTISASGYQVTADVLYLNEVMLEKAPETRIASNTYLNVNLSPERRTQLITIKSGDTLSKLAKTYKTTVKYLAEINKLSNPNRIIAGSKLKVPVGG
jgi:LysM repeat protein